MRNVCSKNMNSLLFFSGHFFKSLFLNLILLLFALSVIGCSAQPTDDVEDVLEQIPGGVNPAGPSNPGNDDSSPAPAEPPVISYKFFYDEDSDSCVNAKGETGYNSELGECSNLEGLSLSAEDFKARNFRGANFKGALLEGIDFSEADLSGADFSNSVLDEISLFSANLEKTKFNLAVIHNSDLSLVKILELLKLKGIKLGKRNRLPKLNVIIEDVVSLPHIEEPITEMDFLENDIRAIHREVVSISEEKEKIENAIAVTKEKRNEVRNEVVAYRDAIKANRTEYKAIREQFVEARGLRKIIARDLRKADSADLELVEALNQRLNEAKTIENELKSKMNVLNFDKNELKAEQKLKSAEQKALQADIKALNLERKAKIKELKPLLKSEKLLARDLRKLAAKMARN